MSKGQSLLVRRIFRAPGYVRCFGIWHGPRLLRAVERRLPRSSTHIRRFNVPGYRAPVYLRDCVADHAVFRQCFVMQQYDVRGFPQHRRLRDAYEQMISEGRTPLIIDGGSNIGLAARWFAAQFPEARIAVVEPDDANFALVVRNTEQLGERIIRLKGGVWDRPARLVITNPQAGATAFTVEERELGEEEGIRAYTIPEICDIAGVADPFIVKLDIEGAQASVFRSNTEWVQGANLITLELDDWLFPWSGCNRSFFACVGQQPFDFLINGESIFCFNDFQARQRAC